MSKLNDFLKRYETNCVGTIDFSGERLGKLLQALRQRDFFILPVSYRKTAPEKEGALASALLKELKEMFPGSPGACKLVSTWNEDGQDFKTFKELILVFRPKDMTKDVFIEKAKKLSQSRLQKWIISGESGKIVFLSSSSLCLFIEDFSYENLLKSVQTLFELDDYDGNDQFVDDFHLYLSTPKDSNNSKQMFRSMGLLY